jgi:hypothetical protein
MVGRHPDGPAGAASERRPHRYLKIIIIVYQSGQAIDQYPLAYGRFAGCAGWFAAPRYCFPFGIGFMTIGPFERADGLLDLD